MVTQCLFAASLAQACGPVLVLSATAFFFDFFQLNYKFIYSSARASVDAR